MTERVIPSEAPGWGFTCCGTAKAYALPEERGREVAKHLIDSPECVPDFWRWTELTMKETAP